MNQERKLSHLIKILGIITHAILVVTRNKKFTNNHSNYVKNNERKEHVKFWELRGPDYASV